jgi:tetratricopeptide (TPR) repeat protein
MRWETTIISLAAVLLAGTANAQSRGESRERCTNATPDIAIVACTAMIRSAQQSTTESLASTFNNRGVAYVDKREYDRAIQDFDQVIKLNPNDTAAFNNRGVAYVDKHEYDRAIQDFDQAIKLNPNYALAFNNRGVAYADKGQYDRTIQDYDQARQLNPNGAMDFYLHQLSREKISDATGGNIEIAGTKLTNPNIDK